MGIRKNRIGAATQRPQADPQETARNRTGAAAPRPRAPKSYKQHAQRRANYSIQIEKGE